MDKIIWRNISVKNFIDYLNMKGTYLWNERFRGRNVLSDLLDTIGLPAKHILLHYFLLHNQPSFDQQLISPADYEYFYFWSADPYYYEILISSMDRQAVGLRLSKLPILLAAFWTIISGRQFQTFVLAMSKERTILMWFSLFSFVPLFFLLTLVFLLF